MFLKKWPVVVTVAALIVLTIIFFWKILLTNLILTGVDIFLYFYPYKAYVTEAIRHGRLPLWNPHLFMGAPLLANSQVGLFYPPNWLFLGLDVPKQVAWSIAFHIALASILMVAFTRLSLYLSWLASLVAAVLFAFGGYLGAQVEHLNQLQAAAWLPLLFLLYDLGLRRERRWFWFLLLALAVGLTLLAGHAQTVFISLFGLGLYGLGLALGESRESIRAANRQPGSTAARNRAATQVGEKFLHAQAGSTSKWHFISRFFHNLLPSLWHYLAPLALVSIWAAALAAVQLLPTAELSRLSIRSEGLTFQEVVSFSLNPTTWHYSLLPPYELDLTQILGEAFGEWVVYLGISGLILAGLGAFSAMWRPIVRRFVLIALSGLLLSFGLFLGPLFLFDVYVGIDSELFHNLARWSHPYFWLYRLVPGFDLFRVPARWLLLYAFGMAILGSYGFEALVRPAALRDHLSTARRRLEAHPKWSAALILLCVALPLALIVWHPPPIPTLVAWLLLTMVSVGLIYLAVQFQTGPVGHKAVVLSLSLLILVELFWAAQALSYNQPTAPQAYHSTRNAISFLQSASAASGPRPERFLSLSGITYDPGDLSDLQHVYGDHLSEKALYNLVVATKEKEVLFFNLPLVFGLYSVDGYDGGILPLAKFVTLQELFLPPAELALDGRLRENLRFVPASQLLSMLGTRWIVTDKQFDAWIDGIFYDLQFPARLAPGQSITTTAVPDFPPTALGLVSHLEGAADLPAGQPAAAITLTFADNTQETVLLRAGLETAEGAYEAGAVAHTQANIGLAWPYAADGVDYISLQPLPTTGQITNISVKATLPAGQFVLRGISLIHQPTQTSRSVILSTEGNYRQVHSGDVKIYENLSVLPHAFIVHQVEVVEDDEQAIAAMKNPRFDPRQKLVLLRSDDTAAGSIQTGHPSDQDEATVLSYEPERIVIKANLESSGWLFLADTYYPGWQATVDDRPVEIFQANVLFRGVPVPAGEHVVEFEFTPRSFRWGVAVTGVTLLLTIAGLVAIATKWAVRRR
jgi:hypothetical protein